MKNIKMKNIKRYIDEYICAITVWLLPSGGINYLAWQVIAPRVHPSDPPEWTKPLFILLVVVSIFIPPHFIRKIISVKGG